MQFKQMYQETKRQPWELPRPLLIALLGAALWAGQAGAADPAGSATGLTKPPQKPARPSVALPFPGPRPGAAQAAGKDGGFVLENDLIAARWQVADGVLRPAEWVNKLTAAHFQQTGAELFRLALTPGAEPKPGYVVAVRLETDKVVALASSDGLAWSELGSFPRTELAGDPTLVRIGKMDLRAQAKDHAGPAGALGQGRIAQLSPLPATLSSGRFDFQAAANRTATAEYPFPAGAKTISCRIDRGTDQGMSWSPALALVWEEGKRFLLIGVREKAPVFNVTTAAGERIVSAALSSYPALDLPASAFRLTGTPKSVRLAPQPGGVRVAERSGGRALAAELLSERGLRAHWRAELRDGSSYIRQTVEFSSLDKTIPLFGVELAEVRIPDAKTIGTVAGCPVAGGGLFFGVEMPGAQNAVDGMGARIGFACNLEVSPTQSYSFGTVAGVAPQGQLRRAFLYYLERERARPSSPFLHYNCWYDLGFSVDAPKLLAFGATRYGSMT